MNTSFRDIGSSFETSAESRAFAVICALLTVFFVGFFTAGLFLGHRQFSSGANSEASVTPAQRLAARAAEAVGLRPASLGLMNATSASAHPVPAVTASPTAISLAPASPPARTDVAQAIAKPTAPAMEPPAAIPTGAIVVQVAAVASRPAAEELAKSLREKHFAAFVLEPTVDNFYRVQTGPYADAAAAKAVRTRLEGQGYQPILKHR